MLQRIIKSEISVVSYCSVVAYRPEIRAEFHCVIMQSLAAVFTAATAEIREELCCVSGEKLYKSGFC